MVLPPEIQIVDLALYVGNALIITDVHIGYEELLNKQGILVPRVQFDYMIKRMEIIFGLVKNKRLETIIINGDLKHEFGTISDQEWRNTLKFLDFLSKHCKEIILIKGNHDTVLGAIANKRNVKILESYVINIKSYKKSNRISNKILVIHGDKIPNKDLLKDVSTIVIGHQHPAISIRDGSRTELFKCFLIGKYKYKKGYKNEYKNLVVQPSFNNLAEGIDILKFEILSPLLSQNLANLKNFEVFVVEENIQNILFFGRLGDLC